MSQHDMDVVNDYNANVRADLNLALKALASQSSGASDPATQYAYQRKARTDIGVVMRRNAANSANVLDGTLAETLVPARSSNTILGLADHMTVIEASATFTQTFTAAATLGNGWSVGYKNVGTGIVTLDPNASETIDGSTTVALNPGESCLIYCDGSGFVTIGRIAAIANAAPGNSAFSFRNKLINGAMGIDQRNAGAAQTITAAAALAYTVDRWYGYCTGANVTGQRVAGTAPNQYNYRYTGAASVTKIGHAQRIEAANCQDLAGTTATLSVDLANSLLTTVTWTAWYANTADTFGTLASPTRTQIATGSFTVNSTLTRYSTNIAIGAAATTGIEIELSVGAQTSGTWTIGRAQLEAGSISTPFENRPIGTELMLCHRYLPCLIAPGYFATGLAYSTTQWIGHVPFVAESRVAPTGITISAASDFSVTNGSLASIAAATVVIGTPITTRAGCIAGTVASGLTTGQACQLLAGANAKIFFTGCEL